jgi:hypothetical protein
LAGLILFIIIGDMKKQTAVEWLIEQWPILESQLPPQLIEQAKQMDREQIEEAYKADLHPCSDEDAEQYYNETFKSE